MRDLVLKFARAYIATGLAVIPLSGKIPVTKHGLRDASTDPEQISQWFDNDREHNLGLPVPAGCVVLDIDPRAGGLDGLRQLESRYGPLPETTTTITGRGDGGRHYFYKIPDGRLSDRELPDGIDIRAGGKHYLVAPPSVHPETGGHYYFRDPVTPVMDCPRWLVDLVRPKIKPMEAPMPRQGATGAGLIRFVAELQEGQRNHGLFWAISSAISDGIWPTIQGDIKAAALSIGLPEHEIETTAASAIRRMRE